MACLTCSTGWPWPSTYKHTTILYKYDLITLTYWQSQPPWEYLSVWQCPFLPLHSWQHRQKTSYWNWIHPWQVSTASDHRHCSAAGLFLGWNRVHIRNCQSFKKLRHLKKQALSIRNNQRYNGEHELCCDSYPVVLFAVSPIVLTHDVPQSLVGVTWNWLVKNVDELMRKLYIGVHQTSVEGWLKTALKLPYYITGEVLTMICIWNRKLRIVENWRIKSKHTCTSEWYNWALLYTKSTVVRKCFVMGSISDAEVPLPNLFSKHCCTCS